MTTLTFHERGFDAAIVLHGDLPSADVFDLLADVPLIAADGAADALVRAGVVPEFVVGDLDSVSADTLRMLDGVAELVVEPDQDANDFEKSIRFAQGQLWKRLLVLGMHGGDLEHTLNNWSVLMRYGRDCSMCALDRGRYAIPVFGSFVHVPTPDELLSLVPQPLANLTTSGLRWELTSEELSLGMREGARNRAVSERVEITVHNGSLLFFCDARFPSSPTFG